MVYLLTRPFVWLFKLLVRIVKLPGQAYKSARDRRVRTQVRQVVKDNKAAKAQASSTSTPSSNPTAR